LVGGADGTGGKLRTRQGLIGRTGRPAVYQQVVKVAAAGGIKHGKHEPVRYSPETFPIVVIGGRDRFTQHFHNHPAGAQEAQAAYNQVV
jgi:hypothetical protein